MSCAICATRKEKRFCPALHDRICPLCCGTEREVTLDCPSDCPYLQQARRHEKPRGDDELDQAAMLPEVEIPHAFPYEKQPLVLYLGRGLASVLMMDRAVRDRELIAALTTAARKYHMLVRSGLHYEHPTTNLAEQNIVAELDKMVEGFRQAEQGKLGFSQLRDEDVLYALVMMLRVGLMKTSGRPKSRAFVDAVVAPFRNQSVLASPQEASRIIVP